MYKICLFLLQFVLFLSGYCPAEDVKNYLVTVRRYALKMSVLPKIDITYASGICVDARCSVVATVYHAQLGIGRAALGVVGGHRPMKIMSLANESDTNKTDVQTVKGVQHFDVAQDIAFVYLKEPIPRKKAPFYSFSAHVGEKVSIAGFRKRKFYTMDAHIIGVDVPVVLGRATIHQTLILDAYAEFGMSGSGVFDEHGKLLGIVTLRGSLTATGEGSLTIALPVKTIAAALGRLDQRLGPSVFGEMPPNDDSGAKDGLTLYEEGVPEADAPAFPEFSASPRDIPDAVERLQAKATLAAGQMANLVAKQCLTQARRNPICYELSFRDGEQSFQEIRSGDKLGTKILDSFPVQWNGVWINEDWAATLPHVAKSPWVFRGGVNDGYLFTFTASAEDERCTYQEYWGGLSSLFGTLFGSEQHPDWEGSVACTEQLLADKDFNVLSIFVERRPPEPCRAQVIQTAIGYGWVPLDRLETPILVPVTETATMKWSGYKDVFYTKVEWSNYRKFRADHKISENFREMR